MTVTLAPRTSPAPVRRRPEPLSRAQQSDGRRDQLREEAERHARAAKAAAESGDIEVSARCILALLACERRLASSGPQVLQLIKPRS